MFQFLLNKSVNKCKTVPKGQ